MLSVMVPRPVSSSSPAARFRGDEADAVARSVLDALNRASPDRRRPKTSTAVRAPRIVAASTAGAAVGDWTTVSSDPCRPRSTPMSKRARKRRDRKKSKANHGNPDSERLT